MAVPTLITDLSTTAASNSPAGSDSPVDTDNFIRALSAFIAQNYANKAPIAAPTFTGTVTIPTLSVTGNTTLGDAVSDTVTIGGGSSKGASGNWSFAAPSSGTAMTINGIGGGTIAVLSATGATTMLSMQDGTRTAVVTTNATYGTLYGCTSNHGVALIANNTAYFQVAAAGNVTIATPSSGVALTISSGGLTVGQATGGVATTWTDAVVTSKLTYAGTTTRFGSSSAHATEIMSNNTARIAVSSAGNVTISAPDSGYAFGIPTAAPVSAGAAGVAGTISWDASYIYVCTATNTWTRVAIATW